MTDPYQHPRAIAALFSAYPGRWGICGGWAIDLFLNRPTRVHKDVDVAVLRQDQAVLQEGLTRQGWTMEQAHAGRLSPWRGEWLALPVHTLWCRNTGHEPDFVEILFNESAGDQLLVRRDTSIRLELERAFVRSVSGIPILAPEVVLLYKAKDFNDEANRQDFTHTWPALNSRQRDWLRYGLEQLHPGHPWLKGC